MLNFENVGIINSLLYFINVNSSFEKFSILKFLVEFMRFFVLFYLFVL